MKKILLILILIISSNLIFATNQVPDYLSYNNEKYVLSTGWGHPSPLQTYYSQNNIKYPFSMISTANYRGHIAFWQITDNKLILKEIKVRDKIFKPSVFEVKSENKINLKKGAVFADWYSGVISCTPYSKKYKKSTITIYFYIKKGKVIDTQIITNKDFKRINQITEKDTSDVVLMEKYTMLYLNQSYISYYFRLNSKNDTIIFNDKSGYLKGNKGMSPILLYYNNDHLKWPYNWENYNKNGAPNCKWEIKNDKIYLKEINLFSGTGFYEIQKDTVHLKSIFKEKVEDNMVFADWISGIYIIENGKEKETDVFDAYPNFEVKYYTFLRIKTGVVIEKYTVPKDFDFKNVPKNTEKGLKVILNELNK